MLNFGSGEIIFILLFLAATILFLAGIVYFAVKLATRKPKHLKKCPFCAEMIQPEAVVCRYCGRDLP